MKQNIIFIILTLTKIQTLAQRTISKPCTENSEGINYSVISPEVYKVNTY